MIVYLISTQDLKDFTSLSDNIDDKLLENSILDAQNIDLQPVIGSKLYDKLKEMVELDTLSGSTTYKNLVDNYIYPFLVKKSLSRSMIFLYSKMKNVGIVNQNGENSAVVDIKIVDKMREEIANDAEFYSNRLKMFLIDNQDSYLEYKNWNSNKVSDVEPNTKNSYQSTIYLGDDVIKNSGSYIITN